MMNANEKAKYLADVFELADASTPGPIVAKALRAPERYGNGTWFFRGPLVDEEQAERDAQFYCRARADVRNLVDEVNRLRVLVKKAEWHTNSMGDKICLHCHVVGNDQHASNCPAFEADGSVR